MKNIELNDEIENFKDEFDVEIYIDNLISQQVTKYKGFYESYAAKIKQVFEDKINQLNKLCEKIDSSADETYKKFQYEQKECIEKSDELNKSLSSTCELIGLFHESISIVRRNMNKFGNAIAIHDLAITRANDLRLLCEKFGSFMDNRQEIPHIPSDFNELLNWFKILQSLKRVVELIKGSKYQNACEKIKNCYDEFEKCIHTELMSCYENMNIDKIKRIIESIVSTETMQDIEYLFIDYFLNSINKDDFFKSHIMTINRFAKVAEDIFGINNKTVLNMYIKKLYNTNIKNHIKLILVESDSNYLEILYNVYKNTVEMETEIIKLIKEIDKSTLEYYRKILYNDYLIQYFNYELIHINNTLKKLTLPLNTNNDKLNIQEICINFIQEIKKSQIRCELLSLSNQYAKNTSKLYETLIDCVINKITLIRIDNITKQININSPFELELFDILDQINSIIHLIDKYYTDYVINATSSTLYYDTCVESFKTSLATLEIKIDFCIDKYLNNCINYIKSNISQNFDKQQVLYSGEGIEISNDILKIAGQIKKFNLSIKSRLNTININKIALEFCIRFARLVLQHYREFHYTVEGAMVALLDIKEYKTAFNVFKINEINEIFDLIHSILNVLIVSADDVKNICIGDNLKKVDTQLVQAFVERRLDYRVSKIGRIDKI